MVSVPNCAGGNCVAFDIGSNQARALSNTNTSCTVDAPNKSEAPSIPLQPQRNPRYAVEYWGRAWQKEDLRKQKFSLPAEGNDIDLHECRKLLAQLEITDLRTRLSSSPWNQYKLGYDVSWLREAAAAFSVQLKFSRADGAKATKNKTQEFAFSTPCIIQTLLISDYSRA